MAFNANVGCEQAVLADWVVSGEMSDDNGHRRLRALHADAIRGRQIRPCTEVIIFRIKIFSFS
jgi:hypothetical protein